MLRLLPAVAALLLVVAFGIAEGLWTDRWGLSGETAQAAARLAQVPRTVGEWDGQDQQMNPRAVAIAELSGYLMRRYVHRRTGQVLSVLLVCGRPGPVSVHPPEVCFSGAGYTLAAPRTSQEVSELGPNRARAQFWTGVFHKDGALPEPMRLFWSWTADGRWLAADNPRLSFPRARVLYKLYVSHALAREDEPLANDPNQAFLHDFLPQLQQSLFSVTSDE
jgi:hypothetical protein